MYIRVGEGGRLYQQIEGVEGVGKPFNWWERITGGLRTAGQATKRAGSCAIKANQIDAQKAVRLNSRYAKRYGWYAYRASIARLIGLTVPAGERDFARAVAQWQCLKGLGPDGVIGKNTWREMKAVVGSRQEATKKKSGEQPDLWQSAKAGVERGSRAARRFAALLTLKPFIARSVEPSPPNALAITKSICWYYNIPWRLGYTILNHEGGVRMFRHNDGVMQTIRSARNGQIKRIPRPLKLTLLGLSLTDKTSDKQLTKLLHQEFSQRLAVQIATGIQELETALRRFNGYVALAFSAYNKGKGSITRLVTGKSLRKPRDVTDVEWEKMCRDAAALLHQPQSKVQVRTGVWLCDPNLTNKWIPRPGSKVYDKQTKRLLRGYTYLRTVNGSYPSQGPTSPCGWDVEDRVQPGSGKLKYRKTRDGAFDKLYNPKKLGRAYFNAVQPPLAPLLDDHLPLKVKNGQLVKVSKD